MAIRAVSRRAPSRTYAPTQNFTREQIEARCEALADELQRLIAALDYADGDPDLEDNADGEPSLCNWGGWGDAGYDLELDETEHREDHRLGWRVA